MPTCEERIYSEEYQDILIDFFLPNGGGLELFPDSCFVRIGTDFAAVYLPKEELPPLSVSVYSYHSIPKLFGLMQEVSLPLLKSGILQIQTPPLNLTGKKVIIGIPDTGIRFEDPVFRREDGSSRILAIWDQTRPGNGTTFSHEVPYGTVYSQQEINKALFAENPRALIPIDDENGHGSNMACIAGGKEGEQIYGAAIDAEFVIVKLKEAKSYLKKYYLVPETALAYSEMDIMMAMDFIDSFSVLFNRPVVFCMGLGNNQGSHNGTTLMSQYLDTLGKRRNRAVIVCSGNEGNTARHFHGVGDTDVEIRVGAGVTGFVLEVWGEIPSILSIGVISPGGESIPIFRPVPGNIGNYRFIYEKTKIEIEGVLVEQTSGLQLVFLRIMEPTPGIWRILIREAGTFDMYLPITGFVSGSVFFLEPSPETTITCPGYADDVITIGGYRDSNNSILPESGRGYSRTGEIKPDLTAPGADIPVRGNRPELPLQVTGTSYSAALTAGAVAQFLEWAVIEGNDPLVKSREIKSYLERGAKRDASMTYPNPQWGYGRLDIQGTFDALRL